MSNPLRYSILFTPTDVKWQCIHCDSGAGKAPVLAEALRNADIHYRSFHTSQEVTVDPAPKRRRPGWWRATARLITTPNTPRRAER